MDFWISICCEFEVNDQLASLINILKYLKALPQDKEEGEQIFTTSQCNKPFMSKSV